MIRYLSFDLDGTIMKRAYADAVWLEGLPTLYAKEKNMSLEAAKKYLFEEYDRVGEGRIEWYDIAYWFHRFNLKSNWEDLLEKYRTVAEPYPETISVIKRLAKNYPLIITSNAKREFIEIQLEASDLKDYFTYIFSSTSDFHKVKKVTEFYDMICSKLGIKPEELIHIGDHQEFDYYIPKKVGITSVYLDRTGEQKGDNIVYDFNEFEKRLTTLQP